MEIIIWSLITLAISILNTITTEIVKYVSPSKYWYKIEENEARALLLLVCWIFITIWKTIIPEEIIDNLWVIAVSSLWIAVYLYKIYKKYDSTRNIQQINKKDS